MPDTNRSSGGANDPGPKSIPGNEPPVAITVGRITVGDGAPADAPAASAGTRPEWFATVLYIEVASLVLLFASWDLAGEGYNYGDYSMSVAVVSLASCLALQLIQQQSAATLDKELCSLPKLGMLTMQRVWALFMLVWWGAGAGVLTFKAPFVLTSNGYFAAWAGLVCSSIIASKMFSQLKEGAEKAQALAGRARLLFGLFACSVVLLLASIDHVEIAEGAWGLSFGGGRHRLAVWRPAATRAGRGSVGRTALGALTRCGVVSAVLVIGFWLGSGPGGKRGPCVRGSEQLEQKLAQGLALLLLAMWICAAGVLTFRAPFVNTGNGFFSSWLGLFAALGLAMHELGISAP